jgi:hypothetical protein
MPQQRIEIPSVGIWPALRGKILPLVRRHRGEALALVKAAGPRTRTRKIYRKKLKSLTRSTEQVPDNEVIESLLRLLTQIAVQPTGATVQNTIKPSFLFECYTVAPELTLAAIQHARAVWFKDSKATRLWRWMAMGEGVRRKREGKWKWVSVWECTDCELATGYEAATTEEVSPLQAEKARKELVADVELGKKIAASIARNF